MNNTPYFDSVASSWDQMRASFFPPSLRDAAIAAAQPVAGRIAADLGAGTGFLTEALLQRGLRVVAVDRSHAMLGRMRSKFGDRAPVVYPLADLESLPLRDGSLDYVFANMALHHVENPPRAIAEAARVLRPGGQLILTDLDAHSFEFLRTEQQDRWLGFQRADVRSWLLAAGFTGVGIDCAGADCCAGSECSSQSARVSVFLARGFRP